MLNLATKKETKQNETAREEEIFTNSNKLIYLLTLNGNCLKKEPCIKSLTNTTYIVVLH